jgi:hypothetical protein
MITIILSTLSLAIGLFLGMALTLKPGKRWGVPDSPVCRGLEKTIFLFRGEGRGQDPDHSMRFGNLISDKAISNIDKSCEEEINEPVRPVMISMLVSDPSGLDRSDDAMGVHALLPKPISTTEYNRTLDLRSSLHLDIASHPRPNDGDRRAWTDKLTTLHDHIYSQILESKSPSHENEPSD